MTKTRSTIWHISSNRWNSAITEYALSSARSLEMRGFRNIFTPLLNSPAQKRAEAFGLETLPLEAFTLAHLSRFKALFKGIAPRAIVTYGGPEMVLLHFLGAGAKRVGKYRFYDRVRESFSSSLLYRIKHIHLEGIITHSSYLKEHLNERCGARVKDITLGCDRGKFYLPLLPQPANRTRSVLLIVGRLDPIKGHERFFKIAKMLLESWDHPDVPPPFVHIIGEPANLSVASIKASAKDVGLQEGSDFALTATRVEDIAAEMAAADVGIVPSLGSEEIARVAEEFLLCGTPICVSGVGALEETLKHPSFGASYRGLGERQIIELLTKLIVASYREELEAKSARAERASALFSLEVMGEKLEEFLIADSGLGGLMG